MVYPVPGTRQKYLLRQIFAAPCLALKGMLEKKLHPPDQFFDLDGFAQKIVCADIVA